MKQPVKELDAYINTESESIKSADDLISFKVSCDTGMCKTAMKKLEAKIIGEHDLLGKWVNAGFGVRLEDRTFEYLDFGSFLITEITTSKDTGTTQVVGYDKMISTMVEYTPLEVTYPISLIDYTKLLCRVCGLEFNNEVFGKNIFKPTLTNEGTNIAHSYCTVELNDDEYTLTASGNDMYFGQVLSQGNTYNETRGVLYSVSNAEKIYLYCTNSTFNKNYITFYDENKVSLGYNSINNSKTNGKTVPANAKYFSIRFGYGSAVSGTAYTTKVMVSYTPINDYIKYNTMNDWQITEDLWANISGITYRDILVQIAQATGSTCIIDSNNQVSFKYINPTGEELTYDNMLKWKLEPMYGEINSVVLSRTPQEDNIYMKDDASIEVNGLTEFRIENNEIVDKDRDLAIVPIYDVLKGIYYYPFETTTEGLGWYEIGDSFNIINDLNVAYKCVLFNYSITIDGGIKEILKATAETKTQTQYQYATPMGKRIKNTEIITNKQQQYIDELVYDMYNEDGTINENFTLVHQDIQNIINSVQNSGGANLLKNSVMFAYDSDGIPNEWTVSGAGTLTIQASAEAMTNGSLSGHTFTLNNKTVKQRVYVKPADGTENQTYYTFSTRIKKNTTGSCYVKIFNDNEEYRIDIASGTSAYYKEYEIKALLPTNNYYDIEFYGSADSDATFTDNMFAVGEYKTQWQQASGEIMNTQVNINLDGVIVKSSIYAGDYTIMSPLEFAGYSNVNGVITKVFTINRDTTEVEKLKVKKGMTMTPIKIVPITTGDMLGWAFVPSTEV